MFRFIWIFFSFFLYANFTTASFQDCIKDFSYVGKDLVSTYHSLHDREWSTAAHWVADSIKEFGDSVQPCHIENLDDSLEHFFKEHNLHEPEWVEELIELWVDVSDDGGIFDFLRKIEPICKNETLHEIVDILLRYHYCLSDIDTDVMKIVDLVSAYDSKNMIHFLKGTKELVTKLALTYVDCKNEYNRPTLPVGEISCIF